MNLDRSQSTVGKTVGTRLYLHVSSLTVTSPDLLEAVHNAAAAAGIGAEAFNVARIDSDGNTIGLLDYPGFFDDPFPALARSWKVDLSSRTVSHRTFGV